MRTLFLAFGLLAYGDFAFGAATPTPIARGQDPGTSANITSRILENASTVGGTPLQTSGSAPSGPVDPIPTSTQAAPIVLSVGQTPVTGPTANANRYAMIVWVNHSGAPSGACVNFGPTAVATTGPGMYPANQYIWNGTMASQKQTFVSNSATPTTVVIFSYER